MRTKRLLNVAIVLWAVATRAEAQYAYVGNQVSGGVAVIDTASDTVVTTIPVGSQPWGIAVAPVGSFVYVTNNADNSLSFINAVTNTVTWTVVVGPSPMGVAMTPTGNRLYVANSLVGTVSVVGTTTGLVMDTVFTTGAFGVAAHPSGLEVYVSGANQVSVIDTATNTVVAAIPVGNDPRGIAVNPAGTRVYVANFGSDTVSVIDTATRVVIANVAVGDGAWGTAVSPDGARVYATNLTDDTVSAIDTASNTVVATIPVGDAPLGVSVHPNGLKAYVACGASGAMCVIDTTTNTELYRIPVGTTPIGLGQFIAGPSPAAASTTVATGTLTVTASLPNVSGTLSFDPGSFSVFGTPVDLAAAVGFAPMSLSGTLAPIPGGLGLSCSATTTFNPSFSFAGTGRVVLGHPSTVLTVPLGAPTGGVLPAGPAYTLTAVLDSTGVLSYQGPFTLGASLPANTPAGTDVTVPGTSTVNLCPGRGTIETPVSVTFAQVTSGGTTLVSGTCQTPGSIPANVRLDVDGFQFFFDVSTTASYTAPITVCVGYPDGNPEDGLVDALGIDETKLVLLHDAMGSGAFLPPVNQSVDAGLNRVCAEVTSLSPFMLGAQGIPKGFVPPDREARGCEHALLKESAKLVQGIITCNRRAAEAARTGKSFDAAGCEVGARAKFDQKLATLGVCPTCVVANAPFVGEAAEALAETATPAWYCAESTPLGGDDLGFVPTDSVGAGCAKRAGKSVAKLTKRLAKCYRKLVDASMKSQAFDLAACLSTATDGFDADAAALVGCPACIAANAPGPRSQVERFVAESLDEVYCAGSVALP